MITRETKPFLMFLTLQEFFDDILVRNKEGEIDFRLGDCFILVISRDITTGIGLAKREYTDTNDFQSKYDNVEFLTMLIPSPNLMEYIGTTGVDVFEENYIEQLQARKPMGDIISICDCVANRNIPVFMICSNSDMMTHYPRILRDYIRDEFGLNGYMIEDIKGKDLKIIYDIGDVDKIRKCIEEEIERYKTQHDKENFFNTLFDDMETAYRDMLSKHSEEELRALAKERNVFVSRRHDKETIIEKIIDDIKSEEG